MSAKKLYQVIKEKQVIAVILATSLEECGNYIIEQNIVDDLEFAKIIEVAKQENEDEGNVIPLMVAKKTAWYDLRHYRNLYIYEGN